MIKAKLKVPASFTGTPEEYAAYVAAANDRKVAEQQAKLDEMRTRNGAFRLFMITPEGVEQIYACDHEQFSLILRLRLPGFIEKELASLGPVEEVTFHGRCMGIRILKSHGHSFLRAGDKLNSFMELGQALGVKNPAAYLYQAKCGDAGLKGKQATIKGVTFCKEKDYDAIIASQGVSV